MEQLDTEWIFNSGESEKCAKTESSAATLELPNMAGVFILVAGGIVAGMVILLIEIACNKRRGILAKQMACARKASSRWRKKVEVSALIILKNRRIENSWEFVKACRAFRTP